MSCFYFGGFVVHDKMFSTKNVGELASLTMMVLIKINYYNYDDNEKDDDNCDNYNDNNIDVVVYITCPPIKNTIFITRIWLKVRYVKRHS